MPYLCTFTMRMDDARELPAFANRALHGAFFRWLEGEDAALAKAIHDTKLPKPYSVSPLFVEASTAYFCVGILNDAVFLALDRAWRKNPRVNITGSELDLIDEPNVLSQSYYELAHNARPVKRVALEFVSPTSFKHSGWDYPLPDPVLVFSSYRARWNAFSPATLVIDEEWDEWLAKSVSVDQMDICAAKVNFGEYDMTGFTGWVEFLAHPVLHLMDGRTHWDALANFASFAGSGHKPTQGLGYTKRLMI